MGFYSEQLLMSSGKFVGFKKDTFVVSYSDVSWNNSSGKWSGYIQSWICLSEDGVNWRRYKQAESYADSKYSNYILNAPVLFDNYFLINAGTYGLKYISIQDVEKGISCFNAPSFHNLSIRPCVTNGNLILLNSETLYYINKGSKITSPLSSTSISSVLVRVPSTCAFLNGWYHLGGQYSSSPVYGRVAYSTSLNSFSTSNMANLGNGTFDVYYGNGNLFYNSLTNTDKPFVGFKNSWRQLYSSGINDIIYGNGLYAGIIPSSGSTALTNGYYSTDLLSWTPFSIPQSYYYKLLFKDGKFYFFNVFGVYTSTNLSGWTQIYAFPHPISDAYGTSPLYQNRIKVALIPKKSDFANTDYLGRQTSP